MSTLLVLILFPAYHFYLKHLKKKNLNFVNYFLLGGFGLFSSDKVGCK